MSIEAASAAGGPPAEEPARLANFDWLRLAAAASVIFSHAFIITEGSAANEPLVRLLGNGQILGSYGVFTFFIISGYLITQSFRRSAPVEFVVRRAARILPGLVACAVAVAIGGGLLAARHYDPAVVAERAAGYVARTALLLDTSNDGLPGLAFAAHDYGAILNGSLWSIGPEAACYGLVFGLGVCGLLRLPAALLVLAVGFWTLSTHVFGNIGFILAAFAVGMALQLRPGGRRASAGSMLAAAAGLAAGAALGFPAQAFVLFGGWIVIGLGEASRQPPGATRFGDLSYGLYLYGWPTEQVVRRLLGDGAPWWQTFLIALPLTAGIAFASWRLVERPALAAAGRLLSPRPERRPA